MHTIGEFKNSKECPSRYLGAIHDTLNLITGKWKISIIASLFFGKKRYNEIEKDIPNINPRMLSKELRDLEANGIVIRTVKNTVPIAVEYELTASGKLFQHVIDAMLEWGIRHSNEVRT